MDDLYWEATQEEALKRRSDIVHKQLEDFGNEVLRRLRDKDAEIGMKVSSRMADIDPIFRLQARPLTNSGHARERQDGDPRSVGKSPNELMILIRDAAAKALGFPDFKAIPADSMRFLAEHVDAGNLFKPSADRV